MAAESCRLGIGKRVGIGERPNEWMDKHRRRHVTKESNECASRIGPTRPGRPADGRDAIQRSPINKIRPTHPAAPPVFISASNFEKKNKKKRNKRTNERRNPNELGLRTRSLIGPPGAGSQSESVLCVPQCVGNGNPFLDRLLIKFGMKKYAPVITPRSHPIKLEGPSQQLLLFVID